VVLPAHFEKLVATNVSMFGFAIGNSIAGASPTQQ
jgi:hypothetical protein